MNIGFILHGKYGHLFQWIEVFDVMGMKEVLGGISNDITRIHVSNASKIFLPKPQQILSQHNLQAHL